MRKLTLLPLCILFAGCSLTPHDVESAPPGANLAVVFDIDGTLTTRVFALRREGESGCEPGPWVKCLAAWPEPAELIGDEVRAPN